MVTQEVERGSEVRGRNGSWVAGGILIVMGVLALAAQYVDSDVIGSAIPLGIGLIFAASGIATRKAGLMVPAGILTGLGTGVLLTEGPLNVTRGLDEGGVVLVCFAAGWVLVTVLTALFTDRVWLWPLIPAAVLGVIGTALLAGEATQRMIENALEWGWPLLLVGVGLWLILSRLRAPSR